MKLYVCSSGNVPRMHAAAWLGKTGIDIVVVTHTNEMADRIAPVMPYAELVVTGITGLGRGMLSSSRNFIGDRLLQRNEWYIGMDDNCQRISALPHNVQKPGHIDPAQLPAGYTSWRKAFDVTVPPAKVPRLFESIIKECERVGTIYGAPSAQDNPFYRGKIKWSYCKYVKAKAYVLKNLPDIRWHLGSSNDAYLTTQVKAEFGAVVVDNFSHAVAKRYEPGGLGTFEERMPGYRNTAEILAQRYPGLVYIDESKNMILRFGVHTRKALAKWRIEHGYDLIR